MYNPKLLKRSHFEFLADEIAPLMGWPSAIVGMADKLQQTNPKFDKKKFLLRATKAWEDANPMEELDDYNPY
tara:strand:+ start:850 stop:1065 length:216 start_codon:yes stop_codon:yes gene_type:complete